MEDELSELVPVFVAEARERLQRLGDLIPNLATDPGALAEAKRELHTLKGAGRMMALTPFAELCHAAEELVLARPPRLFPLMAAAHDELAAFVDAIELGEESVVDDSLLAELAAAVGATAERVEAEVAPAAEAAPRPPAASATAPPEPATGEDRIDLGNLDAFAERAVRVRAAAVSAGRLLARLDELARLAEDGVRDPQPAQALAVLATTLRQAAAETGSLEARLARTGEEQLEAVLALQLSPLRPTLQSLARYARELARALGRELDVELDGGETRLDRRIARELDERPAPSGGATPSTTASKRRRSARRLASRAAGACGSRRVRRAAASRSRSRTTGAGSTPAGVARRAVESGFLPRAAAEAMSEARPCASSSCPGSRPARRSRRCPGGGSGLDAVESAVSRLGGDVFVETRREGGGTGFALDVPVARRGETVSCWSGRRRSGWPSRRWRCAAVSSLAAVSVEERDGGTGSRSRRAAGAVRAARRRAGSAARTPRSCSARGRGGGAARWPSRSRRWRARRRCWCGRSARRARVSPLVDGVALLPSGEPVGVLCAGRAAAQREAPRRAAAPPAPAPPAVRRAAGGRFAGHPRDGAAAARGRRLRRRGRGGRRRGDAAARPSESFDCVVTDIEMPGMDGFELAEELRGMEHFAHLPIVVVSTRDRPEDRLRGLSAGADAYLTKQSLIAADLVETVRRLTGG